MKTLVPRVFQAPFSMTRGPSQNIVSRSLPPDLTGDASELREKSDPQCVRLLQAI